MSIVRPIIGRQPRPFRPRGAGPMVAALLVLSLGAGVARAATDAGSTAAAAAEQRSERGPVSATVRVEPATVRIGDPVTLTLEVIAAAEVELLMPVFGASLERFTILEYVPRERIDDQGRTVSSQAYRLQAPASGEHSIPPITIEFVDRRTGQRPAPEDEDAYELLTERLAFTVESVVPEGAGDDLRPALGALAPRTTAADERGPWAVAIAGIAAAALVVGLLIWRLRGRGSLRSPYQVALERLEGLAARPRPDAEAMDPFFVELSDIVRHYLEDRFGLHAPELTTEEFLDVTTGSPDLNREHRSFLQSFLRRADQVKFARHVPDAGDVEAALAAVREFLEQTASTGIAGPGDASAGAGAASA